MSTETTDKEQKWFRQSQKKTASLFSLFVSTSHNAVYMGMTISACDNSTACSHSIDISGTRRSDTGDAYDEHIFGKLLYQ